MRTSRWVTLPGLALALALTLGGTEARAQDTCDPRPGPDHPLAWPRLEPRVAALLDDGRAAAAYRYVGEMFTESLPAGTPEAPEVRDFRAALEEYVAQVAATGREPPEVWLPAPLDLPGQGRVLAYDFAITAAEPRAVMIPCLGPELLEREPQLAQVVFAARALRRMARRDIAALQDRAATRAEDLSAAYRELLAEGYAMWPWELWLNGWSVPKAFTAPPRRWQVVALRPGVGVELAFPSLEDAEADPVVLLEPLGIVRYRGEGYRHWVGLSALFTVNDDHGVGGGALLRWDDYSLGVTLHKGEEKIFLFLSVDLYPHLLTEKGRTRLAAEVLETRAGE